MDRLRAVARVALSAIGIASGGVLHAQAIQPASDREPAVQPVSELADSSVSPAVVVHLTTVLRLVGAPFDARSPDDASDRHAAAWMFGTAAAIDWMTTAHSLAFHHGHENNPLINWAPTPATTIAAGAAIDVAAVAVWERVMRTHPRGDGGFVRSGRRASLRGRPERISRRARGHVRNAAALSVNCNVSATRIAVVAGRVAKRITSRAPALPGAGLLESRRTPTRFTRCASVVFD